jgi:ABC-type nitrate/sulfonate/bicarbonate transport system permease component
MEDFKSKLGHYALGVLAHLLLLLAWYLFVRLGEVPKFVMPSPADTFGALTMGNNTSLVVPGASYTLYNPVAFHGATTFDNSSTTAATLTLNGPPHAVPLPQWMTWRGLARATLQELEVLPARQVLATGPRGLTLAIRAPASASATSPPRSEPA